MGQSAIILEMSIERRIYFFRADLVYHESTPDGIIDQPSDLRCVFEAVSHLDWDANASSGAYLADGDGSVAVRVTQLEENYVLGQLAKIRRNGLPPKERHGVVSPLVLAEDEGLYEASHFGLFWDQNVPILAMEFNPYAPRQARLGAYLIDRLSGHPIAKVDSCAFSPYIRGDVIDQFLASGRVAEIQVNVLRDTASNLRSALKNNKLGDALAAQAEATVEMETVGIFVHRGRNKKRGGAGQGLKRDFMDLLRACGPGLLKARVMVEQDESGKGKLLPLDLLEDKWVHKIEVPRTTDRMIDSGEFLKQIHRAYTGIALDLIRDGESVAATT